MRTLLILLIVVSLVFIVAAGFLWPRTSTSRTPSTPTARTTSLHAAVIQYPEDLAILLEEGRDINEVDEYGRTPLMTAVLFGKEASVDFLLAQGADPNLEGERFGPPLPWAARTGRSEIGLLLVANGANVEATHASALGRTALHWAAVNGDVELAAALLDRGADIDACDTGMGGAALHHAVKHEQQEMVKLLLSRSAGVDVTDGLGRTPLDVARGQGETAITKLLEKRPEPSPDDSASAGGS